MTAQANYVVVRDGTWTLSHSNLGAYEVCEMSALGPDVTGRFLNAWNALELRPHPGYGAADPQWIAEHICEGGLLVDFDKSQVLVFTVYRGWEFQCAYADAFKRTWPGWRLRWAYDGISALAAHVGVDPSVVKEPYADTETLQPVGNDSLEYIVTVRQGDGTNQFYGLSYNSLPPWLSGPSLLDALNDTYLVATDRYPATALHLDPASQTARVSATAGSRLCGMADIWQKRWPGWTLKPAGNYFDEFGLPPVNPLFARRQFVKAVMGAWAFFLAEDVDANFAEAFPSPGVAASYRSRGWWAACDQTRLTRAELVAGLEMITGRAGLNPRWPDFDIDHEKADSQ